MSQTILSLGIRAERDAVNARQRARQIAQLLGFDAQDQTRISTAVSEIARNAFNYASGGTVEFCVEGRTAPQLLIIRVSDRGQGISNLDEILEGRYRSETGMGMGIIGARRLMDQFDITTNIERGTTVELKKLFPRPAPVFKEADLTRLAETLAAERLQDPVQELLHQNGELLRALEEVQLRQTDLTRVNQELEDTNRGVVALYAELDEKADHLRRADELKTKFLSNMSHEFRSPLNSILALSGLLIDRSDGPLTTEQDQQVGYIRRAATELLDLVNDLLDLAKVEAGKVEAKPIEFEIGKLFAALRGMLRPLLMNNQSVELVFEDADKIPSLYSDEGKISQILRNFISNALKFTERGTVRVGAEMSGDSDLCIWVADTGIGIAAEDQEAIFKEFVQLDSPVQRRVKGTGLGLPLSKRLAAILGGRVEVESQPGVGSIFRLCIPARFTRPPDTQIESRKEHQLVAAGQPVLFVEDKPETLMAYKSYLQNSEFQFVPAATIREAQELVRRIDFKAIVLDIVLQGEDSWTLLANLKNDRRTEKIPILVVSMVEDQAKAAHLGADGYRLKPVDREQLLTELEMLIENARQRDILVIDDNETDRYLLGQNLRKLPVKITEASSGSTGIARAREIHPELIFLDLTMPDMTGFEVLEELKNDDATSRIPVVVVTSRILTEKERELLSPQAAGILAKGGLKEGVLAETIYRTLRKDAGKTER